MRAVPWARPAHSTLLYWTGLDFTVHCTGLYIQYTVLDCTYSTLYSTVHTVHYCTARPAHSLFLSAAGHSPPQAIKIPPLTSAAGRFRFRCGARWPEWWPAPRRSSAACSASCSRDWPVSCSQNWPDMKACSLQVAVLRLQCRRRLTYFPWRRQRARMGGAAHSS